MSEEARDAAFYQEHKDDPELWGAPVEAPQGQRRASLGATITVRFSTEEADLIRNMAKQTGLTYSEVVRKAVDAYLRPRVTIERGRENPIFSQQPTVAPVTGKVLELTQQPEAVTANAGNLPLSLTKSG